MSEENRFLKRLATGKPLVLAEGYIFELERRGYLSAGPFCPEVLLERPEVIKSITQDFVRCGSEVIMACTYYINRPKLKLVGKPGEDVLHKINQIALQIAREVQQEPGNEHCLICGDISNSTDFKLNDEESAKETLEMFIEQAKWAKEGGVDFIVAETIDSYQEASLALKAIKSQGLPALVNLTLFVNYKTRDGIEFEEVYKRLKAEGADAVGINCHYGPKNILTKLQRLRDTVDGPIAGCIINKILIYKVPCAYRIHHDNQTFWTLTDPEGDNGKAFPTGLDPFSCNRLELARFAVAAQKIGVQILGICCGNKPNFTRSLAEALGQQTQLSKYSPQMNLHFFFGKEGEGKAKEYDQFEKELKQSIQE